MLTLAAVPSLGWSQGKEPKASLDADALKKWGKVEIVVLADLTRAVAGPVGLSEPPLRTYTLSFTVRETLRGSYPKDTPVVASYALRQSAEPKFPLGRCLVGLSSGKGRLTAVTFETATDSALRQARLACSIPLGWTVKGENLLSPWAALGKKGWNVAPAADTMLTCSATGRPPLLAGPGVELIVTKVAPKVELKYKNPDGDGEYKVTVKNWTEKEISVPALLTDGKNVLWNESLVVAGGDKAYALPDAKGVPESARPLTLKPGESVSTTINVLKLDRPDYPRGGSRIEFLFCLGERAVSQSFYYFSSHHDKIRESLRK